MTAEVCRRRLKPVILARTEAHGRPFLLDPVPDPAGNQAVFTDLRGDWQTRQLGKDDRPYSFETVYMPHVATCTGEQRQAPDPVPQNATPISRAPSKRHGTP